MCLEEGIVWMKDWRWEGIWYVSGVGGRLVGLEFGDGWGVI